MDEKTNGEKDIRLFETHDWLEEYKELKHCEGIMQLVMRRICESEVETWMHQKAWTLSEGAEEQITTGQGSRIRMGRYEGKDLEWRILTRRGGIMFCLSESGIRSDTFLDDGQDEDFCWSASQIRKWLNETFFFDAFSDEERKKIVCCFTEKANFRHIPTFDRIFLLSVADVTVFMPTLEERQLRGTPDDVSLIHGTDGYWWLRSEGMEGEYLCAVDPDGQIDMKCWGRSEVLAIRPAMLVRII